MHPRLPITPGPLWQATLEPDPAQGARILVWRQDAPLEEAAKFEKRVLHAAGRRFAVHAQILQGSALLSIHDWPLQDASPSVAAVRELVSIAERLVRRRAVRPGFFEVGPELRAAWRVVPDAAERAVLVAAVKRLPPVVTATRTETALPEPWPVVRAFLDAVADAILRSAPGNVPVNGTWEQDIEAALAGNAGVLQRFGPLTRARRSLLEWENAERKRADPRTRLVLTLEPPAEGARSFRLAYALEARERGGDVLGPVNADAVWHDAVEAHVLADDLEPLRIALRAALHKAGQVVAPIELSLVSESPTAAILGADEAWSVLSRLKGALEQTGARVAYDEALSQAESRFPRARVRLERTDGAPPEQVSLAPKYRVRWEVTSGGVVLTPEELRRAAKEAPLARAGNVWMAITTEAAERLAKVAERAIPEWTGPQALSAALAGEVRQEGDLADAEVFIEPGLRELIDELGRDAREVPVPQGLRATLRHYQQRGLAWLSHRTRLGLGALLADDMGLGKTVQLIALLAHLKETQAPGGPTLVVCPASLVGNWEREFARFAPMLNVVRHHGASRLRDVDELKKKANPHDVVLTTYGLARRDSAMLSSLVWGTFVCDEAQNVKNAGSAQARAVREIPALRRVALSGTPVENRLTELWSLIDLLNPALLGPLERFRREIALPIERDRDARAARWLRAATSPFLLRRLKSDPDIAPELPEKEVIRVFCSLTEEQAKLYKEAVDRSLSVIDESAGIERSGRVLRLLTQLKQICNHPAQLLHDETLEGRSGKLDRAAEMLDEIVASDERALVFTQYVEMGERLQKYLKDRLNRDVAFFHGGLSLPERDRMVAAFQSDPAGPPILILSLRAGGVGLNLTRATHVLHYDRWWNPAVEDQATDRAHRIGQTRRVQVHHLISMGTLEERIDRMLEDKRGLADAVVQGGEAWLTELSTDELRALVSLGSDAAVEAMEA